MGLRHLGALTLVGIVASCTTILGNDFVIQDGADSGGAGTTSTGGSTSQGGSGAQGGNTGGTGGDGGTGPVACDVGLQDCPGASKCIPVDADGAGTCVPNGAAALGEACAAMHPDAGSDDCAANLICHQQSCVALCFEDATQPDGDSCPEAHSCIDYGIYSLCEPWCDPIAQDCPAGEGCYLFAAEEIGLVCAPPVDPPAGLGAPCSFINECAPGQVCFPSLPGCNGAACCAQMCDVGAPQCTGGQTCNGISDLPPELSYLGICQ